MTENERVREIRKAKSLTLEEFGAKIGLGKSAVSRLERGEYGLTEQTRLSICREFGVSEEWLRTGEGEMFTRLDGTEALEAELRKFLGADGNNSFKERLVRLLLRLEPEQWETLERYAIELVCTAPSQSPAQRDEPEENAPAVDMDIEAEVEAYRQERLAEKRAAASVSSRSAGGTAGRSETA